VTESLKRRRTMVALIFLLLNLAASIFKPKSRLEADHNMIAVDDRNCLPLLRMLCDCFKSPRRLEAEILILRE
jgi:hypothetical protein